MNTEKTIPQIITNRIKKYGSKILFQHKDGWSWKQVTWLDFEKGIKDVASFLLGLDFSPGSAALMISANRMESLWAESAIYLLGGITIPVDEDASSEEIRKIAGDSGAGFVFAGSESTLDKVRNIAYQISGLEKVIAFSDFNIGEDEKVIPFKGLLKFGAMKRKGLGDKVTEISKGVSPDSLAAVLYDLNSNGEVKRREITHQEIAEVLKSSSRRLPFIGEEDQGFSYLPSTSPFERFINYVGIFKGMRIVVSESREDFLKDILEVKPTVLFETKDSLEYIRREISSDSRKDSPIQKLKSSLGGRIKYIITDSLEAGAKDLFPESEVSLVEMPELGNLI